MDPLQRAGDRTLVVVRHAKAEASGPSDHERPLTARGRSDAAEAGRWLASGGIVPDAALVSDALRTRQTWEELAAGAGWGMAPDWSASLYAAGPETALDLLRETSPAAHTLVLVGHNPTVAYLAELLDDGEGDDDAATEMMTSGFPTTALAVFTVHGPWADLSETAATLRGYHVGRC